MALENNGFARRIYEDSDANLQLQVRLSCTPPGVKSALLLGKLSRRVILLIIRKNFLLS